MPGSRVFTESTDGTDAICGSSVRASESALSDLPASEGSGALAFLGGGGEGEVVFGSV